MPLLARVEQHWQSTSTAKGPLSTTGNRTISEWCGSVVRPDIPPSVIEPLLASCNAGHCGCEDAFLDRIENVEPMDEPGHVRVLIYGQVTLEEARAAMSIVPEIS